MATKKTAGDDAPQPAETPQAQSADAAEAFDTAFRKSEIEAAERATAKAADEGRLPGSMAIANPAPATTMDAASGAMVEPEIVAAVPVDHPSIENNPREGTSAIQNGGDFNDPLGRYPSDPKFSGQGLDLSVYGAGPKPDA